MQLLRADLLTLSARIGRALRAADAGPIAYPAAVELLESLEDALSDLANRLTESESLPVRLVCAWCDITLRDGQPPTSHGICPSCKVRVEEEAERSYARCNRSNAGSVTDD